MLEAVQTANENKIPVELCDREVRVTLRRAWHSMNLWQKSKFLSGGLAGLFEKQELTEEKLAELRSKDVLSEMMDEIGKAMPVLKKVIIDERDQYIAQKMKESKGKKIVSVVGAGHVKGIVKFLESNDDIDLKSIEIIPEPSLFSKLLGWGIPFIIIASIFYIGFSQGITEAGNNALFWILACGIPSAIGSLISAAHPLTILASFRLSTNYKSITIDWSRLCCSICSGIYAASNCKRISGSFERFQKSQQLVEEPSAQSIPCIYIIKYRWCNRYFGGIF